MICKSILEIIGDDTPVGNVANGLCAACGSEITSGGEKFKDIFSKSTFNMNFEFHDPSLPFICNHCSVFFSRQKWVDYCKRNGKEYYFPKVDGKKRFVANWVFFSHAFYSNTHEVVTNRSRWRDLILNPPSAPFCFVISTMCKKHLIFKTPIQYCTDNFAIRLEDNIIDIDRSDFIKTLYSFEMLYKEGLSKSSIKTGDYNTLALLKADKGIFIDNEHVIAEKRATDPLYLSLCEFIASM